MSSRVRAFGSFWYDFIIGDDWRIALGVVAGLVATDVLSSTSLPTWWLLPAVVAILLPFSVWRATRRSRTQHPVPRVDGT